MAVLFAVLGLVVGGGIVVLLQTLQGKTIKNSAEQEAKRMTREAASKAQEITRAAEVEAKASFLSRQEEFEKQANVTRNEIRDAEKRLDKREDQLERQLDTLNIKERNIEKAELAIKDKRADTEKKAAEIDEILARRRADLLKAAEGLSPEPLDRAVEGEWSIRRILTHTGGAEWWYLDRLGLAFPREQSPNAAFERLEKVRAHFQAVLPSLAGDERVVEPAHEHWSPRKMLRRALWHERDHTAHILQFRRRLGV